MGKGCPTKLLNDGSNFSSWLRDFGDFLGTEELADYISNPAPMGRNALQALREDRKALGHLRLSCEESGRQHITACVTTRDAVEALRRHYRSASEARLIYLMGEKTLLRKRPDETVCMYIQRARTLGTEILAAGGQCSEPEMRMHVLVGLPSEYSVQVQMATAMADMTLSTLQTFLVERQNMLNAQSSAAAFVGAVGGAGHRGGAGTSGSGGRSGAAGLGHSSSSSNSSFRPQRPDGAQGSGCGYCRGAHPTSECRVRKTDESLGIFRRTVWSRPESSSGGSNGAGASSSKGAKGGYRRGGGHRSRGGGDSGGSGAGPSRPTVFAVQPPTVAGDAGAADNTLLLDSGAFYHTCPDRRLLHNYEYVSGTSPRFVAYADGRQAPIIGTGELHLRADAGNLVTVTNVKHVPSSLLTLLSVEKLIDHGATVPFTERGVRVCLGSKTVLEGTRCNGGFRMLVTLLPAPLPEPPVAPVSSSAAGSQDAGGGDSGASGSSSSAAGPSGAGGVDNGGSNVSTNSAAGPQGSGGGGSSSGGGGSGANCHPASGPQGSVSHDSSSTNPAPAQLWHRRFGHLGYRSLERLARSRLVNGLSLPFDSVRAAAQSVCGTCVTAKGTSVAFASSTSQPQRALELAHTDVCGPFQTLGRGNSRYVVTLLDSATGMTAVRSLQTRDSTGEALRDMIVQLEARSGGAKVQQLRSDNGGEYVAAQLEQWLKARGIAHQYSAPYTPQQNGAAERLNRTLQDRTRAMLQEAELPPSFWPEAFSHAAAIRNLSPLYDGATPWERFFGRKPDVSGLRTFGCCAYVLDTNRDKLSPRKLLGTYLGYERGTAAYRVPVGTQIIVSCNVTFDEDLRGPASRRPPSRFGDGGPPPSPPTVAPSPVAEPAAVPATAVPAAAPAPPAALPARPATRSQRPVLHPPIATVARPSVPGGGGGDGGGSATVPSGISDSDGSNSLPPEPPEPDEPRSYQEAMASPFAAEWQQAMNEEMAAQLANGTWELAPLPSGRRALACRWVYKVKRGPDGGIERFKARLVAKGFQQRPGVDFGELFAPTTRYASLRALLAVSAERGYTIHQLDVKTAFLHGELEEELWMQQPPGYSNGDPLAACRLRKSIYGLKQAPRCWYDRLASDLSRIGFSPASADAALFVQPSDTGPVFALCHVDDLFVAAACPRQLAASKAAIGSCFPVRDLGPASVYLGMEITQNAVTGAITLSQQRYTQELLERHGLANCKPRPTPLPTGARLLSANEAEPPMADGGSEYRAIIGELNYLATSTRPDIAQSISALARHMAAPTGSHLRLAHGVMRYLAGTRSLGLQFGGGSAADAISGYCASDWAGDPNTRRSTTGFVFGLSGGAISWYSQLQRTVAASSVEAEYQAAAAAVREALWLRKLAVDLRLPPRPIPIQMDSQGALGLAHSPITSVRSKHIDVHHHLVRERVARGEVAFHYCPTESMVADALTKPLGEVKYRRCREAVGLTSVQLQHH